MKKFITLFTLVLIAAAVQSQTLTQKDITGTWLVVNVENSSSNPKLAAKMNEAVINFYADNSFEIKEKQDDGTPYSFKTSTKKNAKWSFNPSSQTISTTGTKMTFNINSSNNKVFLEDKDSGLKYEVVKPI